MDLYSGFHFFSGSFLVMRPKFQLLGNIGLVWFNSSVSSQRCRPPLMDVNVKSRDLNIFDLLRR
jgi:hypothetical protein